MKNKFILFACNCILLMAMLSSCGGTQHENNIEYSLSIDSSKTDSVLQLKTIVSASGDTLEINGIAKDIRQKSGKLPQRNIAAPLSDSKGDKIKVEKADLTSVLPGTPSKGNSGKKNSKENDKSSVNDEMKVLCGRLNIVLNGDSTDIDAFAEDLTKTFPHSEIEIVGIDRRIGVLQLRVPNEKRTIIKSEIEKKLGDWGILVTEVYLEKLEAYQEGNPRHGWHLDALCLKETWKITKGNQNTIIAIVDDGIDANHPMLKDRVLKPLNVFTGTNHVSRGSGHGTHVAALAAGCADYYDSKGAAGVAPNCKIMPVQVFDNEYADCISIAAGIMDAIERGAKIVNVSIGKNLQIFSGYSEEHQQYLSSTLFLPEARIWKRVCDYAKRRNAIIVFAAGNDNVVSAIDPHNRDAYSITVAAVDSLHKSTGFTNYGKGTDISAYGEDIYSASSYGGYESLDGTSMAAPIVSGTIALMRAVKPGISATECLSILQKTGIQTDKYTPVAINPYRAVKYLQTGKVVNIPQKKQPQNIEKGINQSSYSTGEGVAVDLGLSVKWAACNLGASKPEVYGSYYAWGETKPKATYTENNSNWFNVDNDVLRSKGVINSRGNLTARYDAATANWGARWRMPTRDEIEELRSRCRWTWTTMNGVKGYKVTGPSGKSIFLPAAGIRIGAESIDVDHGYCLSSTAGDAREFACDLSFTSDYCIRNISGRCYGLCVRPVSEYIPQKKQPQNIEKGINQSSYPTGEGIAVDLGLSVKWAACNLGASKPEVYGSYYAWGETKPKATYTENNSNWYDVDNDVLRSKGVINSRGNLTARYDAATANWGAGWRMPTRDEIEELRSRCRWNWTTRNRVKGYKVTGPSGMSIFLPAAGHRNGAESYLVGSFGYYWSSSAYDDGRSAYRLDFGSDDCGWHDSYRGNGYRVRPVSE